MSQVDDYSLANLSFPAARARINELLAAIRATNAGPTAPTNPQPGMLWFDTSVTPAVPRQRNAGNTAWVRLVPALPVSVAEGGTGATTAPAARVSLGAPPTPQSAAGEGQFQTLTAGTGSPLVLPAGGRWTWFFITINTSGAVLAGQSGVADGGTILNGGSPTTAFTGFAWRVSA